MPQLWVDGAGWGAGSGRNCSSGTLTIVIPPANRLPRLYCHGMARAPVACSLHSGVTNLDYTLPFPRSFDRHALNVLPLRRGFDAAREAPFTGGALFKRPCASAYSTVNAFIVCEESYINGMCCQEKYFIYGIIR
ncbi:MAG: hypothetical protein WAU61_04365 [Smithella sp.]